MKILITPTSFSKPQNAQAKALIESFADEIVYNPYTRPLEPEEILPLLEGVDGYIAGVDYITAEVFEKAPKSLKVVSRYGAGVDRVDLEAARKRGVRVTNTPGVNAVAVCELAFGLMLSLARAIPRLNEEVKRGAWPRSNGTELMGKTLGVVGLGAIGRNLAVRAKAFGMRVVAYDPYIDEAFARQHGVEQAAFEEVIAKSDFISLHLPLDKNTRHIIGKKEIEAMKRGAFLINTARGGLIDEQAAAQALQSGKLGGLGLDVYETEPVVNSPLAELDNVVMTPHTGAHTNEAIAAMGMMAVRNLIAVLNGEDCTNIVV